MQHLSVYLGMRKNPLFGSDPVPGCYSILAGSRVSIILQVWETFGGPLQPLTVPTPVTSSQVRKGALPGEAERAASHGRGDGGSAFLSDSRQDFGFYLRSQLTAAHSCGPLSYFEATPPSSLGISNFLIWFPWTLLVYLGHQRPLRLRQMNVSEWKLRQPTSASAGKH